MISAVGLSGEQHLSFVLEKVLQSETWSFGFGPLVPAPLVPFGRASRNADPVVRHAQSVVPATQLALRGGQSVSRATMRNARSAQRSEKPFLKRNL